MMKECSHWVRLPSAQSERSLEEGGNLTQVEQLFLLLRQGLTVGVVLTARCRRKGMANIALANMVRLS